MTNNRDLLASLGVLLVSFLVFSGTFYHTYVRHPEGISGTFSIPNKPKSYCLFYGERSVGEASVDYKNDELLSILIMGKVNVELVGIRSLVDFRFEAAANMLGQLMSSRGTLIIAGRILEIDVKGITPLAVKFSERSDSKSIVPMLPPVLTEVRGTVELRTLASGKEVDLLGFKLPTAVRDIKDAKFSTSVMEELARYTGVRKQEPFSKGQIWGTQQEQTGLPSAMQADVGLRLQDGVCEKAETLEYLPAVELLHRVRSMMPGDENKG